MLLLFLMISTVASVVVSAVLGVRLLRLASRTRQLPELTIGASFILSGVIGFVVMLAGNPASGAVSVEMAELLFLVGYAVIGTGVCCLYVFIWRTFRRQAAWAKWLALAGIVAVMGTSTDIESALGGNGSLFWIGLAGRVGAGVWGAGESFLWWNRMSKRLALGLADPVVVNRFMLWGMANVATFSIFIGSTFLTPSASPSDLAEGAVIAPMTSGAILFISGTASFTAVAQWLAFFPPKRYLARVRGDGAATEPAQESSSAS